MSKLLITHIQPFYLIYKNPRTIISFIGVECKFSLPKVLLVQHFKYTSQTLHYNI